ncbi:dTDP-4-dehydrorhamnose 3,5-epimerase [Archangium violaceum]|uniref:dTDP-4-dehydrorhamnose 3,5-epimerase n=1 Tax=Archangium violaceum Cb vi76 TaxID=1406225 RepID=A0A084T1R9_9BACT|nr:dTDP-4-dehydrorhamnose 3,5-epimerase [Archangium violaceum]KFA94654.1 dTDP-4-dehydrorhamnose 3,5-epimerase [Archangium violaceum Cb vi76]
MNVLKTELPGVLILEPKRFGDERGFFMELFHAKRYADAGIPGPFVQDNFSRSAKGILRGLHFQEPHGQGKLVQVLAGAVYDVAVDIRRGSPTFGKFVGVELSADNRRQLWVPAGFAHGFCVLSESADFHYKCTEVYTPASEHGIAWNDPDLAIPWPVTSPLLSPKDVGAPRLKDMPVLPVYEG